MRVRRATERDIDGILKLLIQVDMVHHNGRPDLFKGPATKYNADELREIIKDDTKPVFVCVEDGDNVNDVDEGTCANPVSHNDTVVLGHAFCIHQQIKNNAVLTDVRTLYIDDICVDENARGKHIGRLLYDSVLDYAKKEDFYNITLNVWTCNPGAMKFYEAMGLKPQKIGMEKIIMN